MFNLAHQIAIMAETTALVSSQLNGDQIVIVPGNVKYLATREEGKVAKRTSLIFFLIFQFLIEMPFFGDMW